MERVIAVEVNDWNIWVQRSSMIWKYYRYGQASMWGPIAEHRKDYSREDAEAVAEYLKERENWGGEAPGARADEVSVS